MDANFPFFNGYPLLPHISHKDGKKLDVAFCYTDNRSGQPTSDYPPHIAYGVSEGPVGNEKDQIQYCESRGNWQYSYMSKMMPKGDRDRYMLDKKASRYMVEAFQNDSKIGKILIEPHLIPRLHLKNGKIRYHGCNSVRHDDHIHIQIR
jgi:hypothetical protein